MKTKPMITRELIEQFYKDTMTSFVRTANGVVVYSWNISNQEEFVPQNQSDEIGVDVIKLLSGEEIYVTAWHHEK